MARRKLVECDDGLWGRLKARAVADEQTLPAALARAIRQYLSAPPLVSPGGFERGPANEEGEIEIRRLVPAPVRELTTEPDESVRPTPKMADLLRMTGGKTARQHAQSIERNRGDESGEQ